jgi:small subunit ribosomal protein S8e
MAVWHGRSKRKPTGGKLKRSRKHKKYELGRLPALTKLGELKMKVIRARGGNRKFRLKSVNYANVVDPETKRAQKIKIVDVVENKANPHFVREKIITKGAIVKLEDGRLAKVTSRPGQDGVVNAVVVEKIHS